MAIRRFCRMLQWKFVQHPSRRPFSASAPRTVLPDARRQTPALTHLRITFRYINFMTNSLNMCVARAMSRMLFGRRPLRAVGAFVVLALLGGLSPAFGQQDEPVADAAAEFAQPVEPKRTFESGPQYEVDLTESITHYIRVEMTAESTGPQTQVMMAVWTPGSYLVREYARHIDYFEVEDEKGNPLEYEKISKNRWQIETGDARKFVVRYRLFCLESSVRTNWVGRNYAVLNGAPTFLTVPEQLNEPHTVQLKMPEEWAGSATSMRAVEARQHQYTAKNFDELVDSPIVAGNVKSYPFVVNGVVHQLVNVNDPGVWDGEKSANDLAKIVAAHHEMWKVVPYDRYLFINVIGGGGGGLEHDYSCLMMSSPSSVTSEASYRGWLSLASHEFFHTWNVRRLRPKALVRYDYENEVYTPSLWVAEGVTSYYEDLLLVRAGLMSEDDFLRTLGGSISSVQRTAGRRVQSLRDSSHDAWIKYYRRAPNSRDTQISYYTKGAVVAFLLDARIRAATDGKKSLDDVMRKLYEKHAGDVGYTPADLRNLCSEMAGEDLGAWFATAVDSTEELDYQSMADWFGLDVGDIQAATGRESRPATRRRTPRQRPWLGVGVTGSPATRAGLADSDEVLAVNDRRLQGDLESGIQDFEVGEPLKLLVDREGEIVEVLVVLGARPTESNWRLSTAKGQTDAQEQRVADWLQEPQD